MIDAHCHLTYKGLDEIKEQVIKEARKEMNAIITCGLPEDAKNVFKLSEEYLDFVYVTLGIHPTDVIEMNNDEIEEYKEFIIKNKKKIVGIGEIGLDYHWIKDSEKIKRTKDVFIDFINLAKELKLPIILHTRKAEEDVLKIIVENDVKNAIFHSYTGNITLAKRIIEEGYYISINTLISSSKNSKKIVKNAPIEQLITETDSPFLSPYPGKVNMPQNVKIVLEKMSEIRKESIEEIDKNIIDNCKNIFNVDF